MSDPLPVGLAFSSVATTQGTCSGGQVVTCQLGTISNGSSVVVAVLVKMLRTGLIVNTATTVGQELDANSVNDTVSATTTVKRRHERPSITLRHAIR